MTGAMSKNEMTGHVEYNNKRCASCYMCIMACPYGVLKADSYSHKYIMKCDLCGKTDDDFPNCVKRCPMGALSVGVSK
jgi:carbon-monoxide dehydrogenase iron sulfur subunit